MSQEGALAALAVAGTLASQTWCSGRGRRRRYNSSALEIIEELRPQLVDDVGDVSLKIQSFPPELVDLALVPWNNGQKQGAERSCVQH